MEYWQGIVLDCFPIDFAEPLKLVNLFDNRVHNIPMKFVDKFIVKSPVRHIQCEISKRNTGLLALNFIRYLNTTRKVMWMLLFL